MKLDVTAAKLTAAVRCYGLLIRELTVGVVEYLEATEILLPSARNRLIAARRQDHRTTGGHHANLMGIDSGSERRLLPNFGADRAVGVQAMNGDAARIVESGKHMLAAMVDGDVDRPMAQADGIAERLERSRRIDFEGVQIMVLRIRSRMLIAACYVEMPAPLARFLNFFGYDDRLADLDEGFAVVRNPVAQQPGADVGIDIRSYCVRLLRRREFRGGRAPRSPLRPPTMR